MGYMLDILGCDDYIEFFPIIQFVNICIFNFNTSEPSGKFNVRCIQVESLNMNITKLIFELMENSTAPAAEISNAYIPWKISPFK